MANALALSWFAGQKTAHFDTARSEKLRQFIFAWPPQPYDYAVFLQA
jgi:hypothetical protein